MPGQAKKLYRTVQRRSDSSAACRKWAGTFERYWQHQLNRVKERAEAMVRQGSDLKSQELKEKK